MLVPNKRSHHYHWAQHHCVSFHYQLTQPQVTHSLVLLIHHQLAYGFNSRHMATWSPFFLFVIQHVYPWLYHLACNSSPQKKGYRCTYRIMHVASDIHYYNCYVPVTILDRSIHSHPSTNALKSPNLSLKCVPYPHLRKKMPQHVILSRRLYALLPLEISLWGYHWLIFFLVHPSSSLILESTIQDDI